MRSHVKEGRVKQSLRVSFWDGVFYACMTGLVSDYLTPYALALKATPGDIGILAAAPSLVATLTQSKAPDLTERFKSRTTTINLFVFMQALMLIPIMAIPYLFKANPVIALIIFATLFTAFGGLANPPWAGLMAEYIPARKRGAYFGWRNKITGIVTVAASFVSGFILFRLTHNIFVAFLTILILAFICRLISWGFLTRMYEPRFAPAREDYFSIWDFIKRMRQTNFGKFVFFAASFNFCVQIAAPFFPVFMLKDLQFNYLTYTLLTITVTAAQIIAIDRWGMLADRTGNIKVLKVCSLLIAFNPLFWIINRHPAYLIFAQIAAGFSWAGFNICATNFIYDAVTPQKRVRCIAYFNVLVGLGIFLGALCGGLLATRMPILFGYRLLSLFLLASIMRFAVIAIMAPRIHEVRRAAEPMRKRDLFYSVIGIKPLTEGQSLKE